MTILMPNYKKNDGRIRVCLLSLYDVLQNMPSEDFKLHMCPHLYNIPLLYPIFLQVNFTKHSFCFRIRNKQIFFCYDNRFFFFFVFLSLFFMVLQNVLICKFWNTFILGNGIKLRKF